jgi:hypothetical protein
MNTQKRKLKIYIDEAKNRQTTHWDWDCMTTEEIQAAYRDSERLRNQAQPTPFARRMATSIHRLVESVTSIFRNRNPLAS